ncbi:retention module-containing protein [Marinobacterium sp. xm-d-564]|uniref:retention module-containing protein n=1 Tax=Marinobacterium sp. xm-d-564 TaxID=2497742 RepID=UPI00156A6F49|nr:retention module-containing protein [Marinobacterium sp. xm-d-564]NRP60118.1 Serralysin G precursor [Marinobacterium sp. xm-d-564]
MANPVIATVQSVTAPITVRDESGALRQVNTGDQLRLGDVALTENGQTATLQMTDGTVVTLSGAKETLLSYDLMATTASSADEAAISESSLDQLINDVRDQVATNTPEVDQILAALQGDGTIDNLLEETAAGLTGEGEGEGHSFIILDRIDEQIELALTTTTPFIVTEEQVPFEGVQRASFNLPSESDVAPNIAQFTDNFVNGVSYTTSSGLTGLTGDAGEPGSFRYNDGDTITFSIGAITIAEFSAGLIQGPYLFIQDLKGLSLSETNDQFVENVAIFLQALDSDLDDGNNQDGLQTQDISAEEASAAFSNNIEITAAIRTLFENYVDPATGQALNLMNSGKGQVSDALSKAGVEFTAKSEMEGVSYEVNSANGGTVVIDEDGYFTFTPNDDSSGEQSFTYTVTNNSGDTVEMTRVVNLSDEDTLTGSVRMNSFETLAMQHVQETIGELAGDRAPEAMDARTEDTWGEFLEGTESDRVVNYSTAPEALQFDDAGIKFVVDASMLAYGYVPKQINDDSMMNNMDLSDVSVRLLDNDGAPIANRSLFIEFDAETKTGVVTLTADDDTSLDELAVEVADGLLENLAFDYTIWDWTVPVKVEGAGAIDAYKSHLSANPTDIVEDGVYSQFVVNSTLAFDEAQKLTVKFSPEGSGTDFAEYSDDFSVPIQYRNGDGDWIDMQVLDETYTRADYDKPLPIFEFELAAGSTAVEIRIPVFDDPYIENTEIIDMLVEGDNFYSENIQAKILDNDSANTTPIVEVNFAVVNEEDGYASLTFSLVDQDGNLVTDTSDTTITYQTADLSAKAGLDYTVIPNDGYTGTAVIVAGVSTVTIQVPIIDDSIIEQTEFFKVDVLSVSDNAVLGDPEASVRIYDNDGMTITGDAQQEGTNITYTVVLSSELPSGEKIITLTPTNSGATASVNDDYSLNSVSVTYTDGDLNTQTISANSDGSFTLPDAVTTFQASYSTVIDNTPDGGVDTSRDETARLQVQVEYQSGDETLTITGLGEATILDANSPEADSVEVTGGEDDSSITITLVGSDIDLNDSIETFTLSNLPANGTLYTDVTLTTLAVADTSYAASDDELTLYFVPDENWNGETNFNFTANDGELDSEPATATIKVTPVNDRPTIDVTVAATFNENDAVAGQTVATFSASDEEDGTLTVAAGDVTFTGTTNSAGYYAFDGENVVLTQAGVDAINAGTSLPAVDLTATDSGSLTANANATPTYTAENDGPTITVKVAATFNENDAVVGQTVATFSASDEEDGTPSVDFTGSSNSAGYYAISGNTVVLTSAGVAEVNAGTTLPSVNLTATDSQGLTASDNDLPSYNAQNDGPTITVTAEATFNENHAVVGQTVATFTASDEEDGTLTVAAGDVTFTGTTNSAGYYAFDGENVVLTQAGVNAINAGTTLPAVDLTATDSGNLSANANATPTYAVQNDAPNITVTANDFIEDAGGLVAGTSVAGTYTTSDEEGDTLTVTFNTSSDHYTLGTGADAGKVLLTQDGIGVINAGGDLDAIYLKVSDGLLGDSDSDTPVVTPVNDAPTSTDDSVTTDEDVAKVLSIDDFGTYSDIENSAISSIQITTLEDNGRLEYDNNGTWEAVTLNQVITKADIDAGKLRFVPDENENGAAYTTVGFKVNDGTDFSVDAYTLTVNVTPVNDAPTLSPGRIILSETFESTNGSDIESRPNGWYVEKGSNNEFTGSSGVMWTVDAAGIEIQGNVGGSAAYEGSQHAELDSHGNDTDVKLSTTFDAQEGEILSLTFAYKPRPGVEDSSDMKVTLGGKEVSILSDSNGDISFVDSDGVTASQTEAGNGWTLITLNYLPLEETDNIELKFEGLEPEGVQDSVGAYIDDIQLVANTVSSASITEIEDSNPLENIAVHSSRGQIAFEDVDLTDQHDVKVSTKVKDESDNFITSPLGSLTLLDNTNNTDGTVEWVFTVDDSVINHLAANESLTQVYTVTVDDKNGGKVDQNITVVITGVNDAPEITVTANDFIENAGGFVAGTSVAGTYTTSDEDGDALTVTFNTASSHYTLDTANNQVLLTQAGIDVINAGGDLDAIDLKVSDGSRDGIGSDTPEVTETNDPMTFSMSAPVSFTEGTAAVGDSVATVASVNDPDGGAITYTIDDTTNYAINSSTGAVTLTAAGAALANADTGADLPQFTVTATSAGTYGSTADDSVDPSVTETNDPMTFSMSAPASFTEGTAAVGDLVATVASVNDPDGGAISYSISDTTNYAINSSTGAVTLTAAGAALVNADTGADLPQFTVTATSAGTYGSSADSSVDPSVTETNDPMTFSMSAPASFTEGTAAVGDSVATVASVNDPDGGAISYSISDTTNYAINSSTGAVTLTAAGAALVNADTGADLPQFTVTATSAGTYGSPATDSVDPSVTETNDVPTITTDSGNTNNANDVVYEAGLASGSGIGPTTTSAGGTITFADADGLDDIASIKINSATYTVSELNDATAGTPLKVLGEKGTLSITDYTDGVATYSYTLNSAVDHEAGASTQEEFTLTLSDGSSSSDPVSIGIDIEDDAPVARSNANGVIDSNNVQRTDLGFTVKAFNPDGTDGVIGYQANPKGFGVVGNVSGASVELGADSQRSESIVVTFDTPVSSVDLVLAWQNGREHAIIELFEGDTNVGTHIIEGGTDRIDEIGTLTADENQSFTSIRFSAPTGGGHDYLINSIGFNQGAVQEGATLTVTAENGVLENDESGVDGYNSPQIVGVVSGSSAGTDTKNDSVGNVINGTYGQLTLNADGSYEYQSTSNAVTADATDTFTYTIQDADGDLDSAILSINITNVTAVANVAPEVTVTANDFTEDAGGLVAGTSVAGTYTTSDGDGDTLTVTFNTSSDHYTLGTGADAGKVFLTQDGIDVINAGGDLDAIDLKVSDGSLDDTDSDTPVVTDANDPSVLTADTASTKEDVAVSGNVLSNDSDEDDVLSVASFLIAGESGTFTLGSDYSISGIGVLNLAADGSYTFTPSTNWNGSVPQVTYTTNTGSSSTLDITVDPVADYVTGSMQIKIGSELTYDITGEYDGSDYVTDSGVIFSPGDGTDLNISGGLGVGVDSSNGSGDQNRIDIGETVHVNFDNVQAPMSSFTVFTKNTKKDTLSFDVGLNTKDMDSSDFSLSGSIAPQTLDFISSNGNDEYLKIEITVAGNNGSAIFDAGYGVDANDEEITFNHADNSWSLSSRDLTALGTISSVVVSIDIDGSKVNLTNGGDNFGLNFDDQTLASMVITNTSEFGNSGDGYQIDDLIFSPGTYYSKTYAIDISAQLVESVDESWTGPVTLSGFPTGSILYYVDANDVVVEIASTNGAGEEFVIESSVYGAILDNSFDAANETFADKLFINTPEALDPNFIPDFIVSTSESGVTDARSILGGTGNSTFVGSDNGDNIDGGAGDDTIIGGKGEDILTGGLGDDVFAWTLADADGGNDTVTDFGTGSDGADSGTGVDALDLGELLQNEDGSSASNLLGYIHISKVGDDTIVKIDADGGSDFDNYDQQITLEGMDLVTGHDDQTAMINDLLSNGKLITD